MNVKIYSKDGCKYCELAKQFLKEKNIEFEALIPEGDEINSLKFKNNWKTFPFIFINKQFIGGYQELKCYFDESF